jgi:pyruvate oxidase
LQFGILKQGGNMWRCTVCGYIYDEAKEGVKFEDLPDDWVCPACNAPKDVFEKV